MPAEAGRSDGKASFLWKGDNTLDADMTCCVMHKP